MVEIGPRAEEARRIPSLPMEDRVCEIIELLKASSSRQAVLEEAAKVCDQIAINAERRAAEYTEASAIAAAHDKMGAAKNCAERIRALDTTPPAEGETK